MKLIVKNNEKLIKFIIHNVQGVSFSMAQKMLRKGDIKVDGKRCKENIDLVEGNEVDVYLTKTIMPSVPILYEYDNLMIVVKPYGIECATMDKSSDNTYSLEEIFADKNVHIIHRLDRMTEGLVVLSKTNEMTAVLGEVVMNRQVVKSYKACVLNCPLDEGVKTAYLKKDSEKSLVKISDTPLDGYKEIVTEYNVEKRGQGYSVLDVKLHTGRTHQIRAYMSHIGCPIINDTKYSNKDIKVNENVKNIAKKYKGYFLTAYKLQFCCNGALSYLNNMNFEIKPSWIDFV